jgi:maltose alpha-D-glucosyltransferase/alpha-amylase
VEAFGRIPFWEITDQPYPLTIGPHAFYWFLLTPTEALTPGNGGVDAQRSLPIISTARGWADLVTGNERSELERLLPRMLARQPWLRGAPDTVLNARLLDAVSLPHANHPTWLALVRVAHSDRDPETYLLALAFLPPDTVDGHAMNGVTPIAQVRGGSDGDAVLVDALHESAVRSTLHWLADTPHEPWSGRSGQIVGERLCRDEPLHAVASEATVSPPLDAEGNNPVFTSDEMVIKFLRRINEGINPEWEIGQALTDADFPHTPAVLGALHYQRPHQPPMTIAVLQERVVNDGHAWEFTARFLDDLLDRTSARGTAASLPAPPTTRDIMAAQGDAPPEPLDELLAPWLQFARLLGRRTAELHRALATARPEFAPEPYTAYDRRSIYQSMRGLTARALRSLHVAEPYLEEEERRLVNEISERQQDLFEQFRGILNLEAPGCRVRGHGDFHLGQVLMAGDDLVFVDFEGEPDRFLEERRLKTSPLRDVAGMLHSIQMSAVHAANRHQERPDQAAEAGKAAVSVLNTWLLHGSATFIRAYCDAAEPDGFLPGTIEDRITLLDALVLERAVYVVWHAAQHQQHQLRLPLLRLHTLLSAAFVDPK